MANPIGVVLARTRSLWTGDHVTVVATGLGSASTRSANRKTGDVIQTWILPTHHRPDRARKRGLQGIVCGDCLIIGECYVNTGQAPLQVWESLHSGTYPTYSAAQHGHLFAGRMLRLGSWGDPALIPRGYWLSPLSRATGGSVGYTHQWRTCDQRMRVILMASCDTPADYWLARSMGWRTFRVRLPDEPLLPGEFVCPASDEGGWRRTCLTCGACDGAGSNPGRANPCIILHGSSVGARARQERFAALSGRRIALPLV